ncbi:NAD(P)/FAD-dependent oxidoreductase [Paenibacillus senegalensis]|uniref:NAD(P)/FAD-dependent oxidoreductase n=1 Tax=Paenibacillus senegalensis TaxID=1465766 RepID=UPI000288AE91|nr:NAD(P)/FAD-dependent oxidoreductase [Paenibacillus senegalensis]
MDKPFDCLIVGAGPAGCQAAILLGRYDHRTLVIDAGYGRSTLCRSYNNILGWPDGISGEQLRLLGKFHAMQYGVQFVEDQVQTAEAKEEGFLLKGSKGDVYRGKLLLLATGLIDRLPDWPELTACLGRSIYVCPDCDGYEVADRKTIVIGSGEAGAHMALSLRLRTDQLAYVNHEQKPLSPEIVQQLAAKEIGYKEVEVSQLLTERGGYFQGVRLKNGETLLADKAFVAFGGNHVRSELAEQLGIECEPHHHIPTDPRTKQTRHPGVWAVGDVGVHSQLATIAMGEGAQAAIWMNKALLSDT